MKAKVDKDTCIACGLCPSICPECFDMEDDGKACFIVDEAPENVEGEVQEAAESCPVDAISVEK
ncbi:ferredoxin [Clostridium saccharobutylicum]|uniref:ferredoxin n=1 Tax=Clostridium saccharobutylicum TaxID=169679 RepID=UPI0007E20FCD|nr:ferredoxin [Clostridium saccharobutylicum]OAV41236.1 ferredoxin [Clostridium saccharobutylicum DSM 13864]